MYYFFFFYLIQILTPLTTASQFLSSLQQKKKKIQLQILTLKILKLPVAPLIEESLATNVQLQPNKISPSHSMHQIIAFGVNIHKKLLLKGIPSRH